MPLYTHEEFENGERTWSELMCLLAASNRDHIKSEHTSKIFEMILTLEWWKNSITKTNKLKMVWIISKPFIVIKRVMLHWIPPHYIALSSMDLWMCFHRLFSGYLFIKPFNGNTKMDVKCRRKCPLSLSISIKMHDGKQTAGAKTSFSNILTRAILYEFLNYSQHSHFQMCVRAQKYARNQFV